MLLLLISPQACYLSYLVSCRVNCSLEQFRMLSQAHLRAARHHRSVAQFGHVVKQTVR